MKRFVFPPERVRRWRQEQLELQTAKLQQLCGQLAALGQEKARIESEGAASAHKLLQQASIDAGELQALDAYRQHVRARIAEIERGEQQVRAQIEQQRARVIEARRQAELLERLKAKMFEQWQALAQQEEETLAGELYLAKWGR